MIYDESQLPAIFLEDRKGLRKLDDDILRYLNERGETLKALFGRGLTFGDNFDAVYVTLTAHAVPNTEFTVAHTLGRTPTGYIPVTKDRAADIYNSTAMDASNLYLKCDVASAVIKLLVF